MRITLAIALLFVVSIVEAQPPATDIYLLDLKISGNKITATNPINVTPHAGYDNQPFFHREKTLLYYVATNEQGKTDIVELNYGSGATRKLTNTKEGEFSPTVTPDDKFISCIIQYDDGRQDLAKYPIDGGSASTIISDLTVGYHTWIDNDNILVFALGTPNTLVHHTISTGNKEKIADNPGRSFPRLPGKDVAIFVDKNTTPWQIRFMNNNATLSPVVAPEREDLTIGPKGEILMSDGVKIYFLAGKNDKAWKEVSVATHPGLKNITRMAINAAGNKLAVVVSE